MRLRDRLIKGTVLNLIAVAFNQGSTLIANITIARILMKQGFGEYAIVQSTLLTLAALSQLATGYTASKYIAEYRSSDPEKAGRIMGLCALVSAIMAGMGTIMLIAIAPWLADTMLKAPHLSFALMIGSGFLLFSAINGYQTGALSGLEAYGSLAKAGVTSGIVAVAAISLGAWLGGLNGTLIGLSISAFVRCAIHNRWLLRESSAHGIVPRYRDSFEKEKAIIYKFALPSAIAGYYSMPMIWLANSFLFRQPEGYGEMALYASASSMRLLVLFIPHVINNVSLSILNSIKGSGDVHRYNRAYRYNVYIILITTLTCGLAVGLSGDTILAVFGEEFISGRIVLQVLMISTVFEGIAIALYQHLQAQEKIWSSFFMITIPKETIFVVIAFMLVPMQGAVGLSIAYASSWLLTLAVICMLVYREKITIKDMKSGVILPLQEKSFPDIKRYLINLAKEIYFATPYRALRSIYYRGFCAIVRNRMVQASIDGINYRLDLGEVIDVCIYLNRYEPDMTAAIEKHCQPGFIVLDIGANIGAHALRLSKIVGEAGRVYAFEPMDYAYQKLVCNISLNYFKNIVPVQIALSDKNLLLQSVNFKSSWPTKGKSVGEESIVDFMKLDDWSNRENIERVDLIKLDVDGNEYSLIMGAETLLANQHPIILMEVWGPNFMDCLKNPYIALKRLGYRFFHIDSGEEYGSIDDLMAIVSLDGKLSNHSFNIIARYWPCG